jgi:hypothetical protein
VLNNFIFISKSVEREGLGGPEVITFPPKIDLPYDAFRAQNSCCLDMSWGVGR